MGLSVEDKQKGGANSRRGKSLKTIMRSAISTEKIEKAIANLSPAEYLSFSMQILKEEGKL